MFGRATIMLGIGPHSSYMIFHIISGIDIDECASNNGGCSVMADCSNIDGGFTCTCQNGYVGDGFTCKGIIIY